MLGHPVDTILAYVEQTFSATDAQKCEALDLGLGWADHAANVALRSDVGAAWPLALSGRKSMLLPWRFDPRTSS